MAVNSKLSAKEANDLLQKAIQLTNDIDRLFWKCPDVDLKNDIVTFCIQYLNLTTGLKLKEIPEDFPDRFQFGISFDEKPPQEVLDTLEKWDKKV